MSTYYSQQMKANEYEIENRGLKLEKLIFLGQTVSSIVHQIKNPINSMFAGSQLLLMEDSPEEMKREAKEIASKAKETTNLLDGLRDFIKMKGSEETGTNVNTVIDDVLGIMKDQFLIDGISVIRKYGKDVPEVVLDANLIRQAFLNVVNNAREAMLNFTGNGRTLTVETASDDKNIIIRFIDAGPGIPENNLPYIFNMFYTTKKDGLGTGLNTTKRIVEKYNGRIWETGNNPTGAVFNIELPYKKDLKEN
jgi:signal transduction histidine kinase